MFIRYVKRQYAYEIRHCGIANWMFTLWYWLLKSCRNEVILVFYKIQCIFFFYSFFGLPILCLYHSRFNDLILKQQIHLFFYIEFRLMFYYFVSFSSELMTYYITFHDFAFTNMCTSSITIYLSSTFKIYRQNKMTNLFYWKQHPENALTVL